MTSSPSIVETVKYSDRYVIKNSYSPVNKSYEISVYLNKDIKHKINVTSISPHEIIWEDTVFVVNGTFTETDKKYDTYDSSDNVLKSSREFSSYDNITYNVIEQQNNGLPVDFKPFEILPYSDLLNSDALFLIYTEFVNDVMVNKIYGRCYIDYHNHSFTLGNLLSLEAIKLKTTNATMSSFNDINNDNKMFDINLSNILNDYVTPDYEPLKLMSEKKYQTFYYTDLYNRDPDEYHKVMDQQMIIESNRTPTEEIAAQELENKLAEENRIKYSEVLSDFWNIYLTKRTDYKLVAFDSIDVNGETFFEGRIALSSFDFNEMFENTRLYPYIKNFTINESNL
jgi:hypothetical protein